MEDASFCEFRRKVKEAELLSGSTERLLKEIKFSGRLSVVVKNGLVQCSGYEESLFQKEHQAR